MKADKVRKPRRFRLSRGWQIARNLLLGLLLVVLAWGMAGYPLFLPRLEFRRLERENLLPRSEIVLEIKKGTHTYRAPGSLIYNKRWSESSSQFVGLGEGYAVTCWLHPYTLDQSWAAQMRCWPFDEQEGEFKLVPLASLFTDWRNGDAWASHSLFPCRGIVVPALPEGTAWAELAVLAKDGTEYREIGSLEGEGVWLFAFRSDTSGGIGGRPYTLTARDGDGNILAFQKGTVPEAG